MSFSSEVKNELATIDSDDEELRYVVLGLLVNSASIRMKTIDNKLVSYISIKSHINQVISIISSYLKKYYHTYDEKRTTLSNQLNSYRYYYLDIYNVDEVIKDFKLLNYGSDINLDYFGLNDDNYNCFIRGLFLAHGSISNPRMSDYHYEIVFTDLDIANLVKEIFLSVGINSYITIKERKRTDNLYILYIKKSESISDALAFMGASSGMFHFEDQRIYRDFKNNANRVSNCDIANERKCSKACMEQLKMIDYIKDKGYFPKLSIRLQSFCNLREMFPDSSMDELAEYSENVFGKTLSKSGISHCLKDLKDYYNSIIKK